MAPSGRGILVLILALLPAFAPAATFRPVLPGPPRAVITQTPKLGVHTRLTDEVEPWKIRRTLEMVRELGAPWAVEFFPWIYHEPRPGQREWGHADLVVEHARSQGLRLLARVDWVPQWARPEDTTGTYLAPERYPDLARFLAAFAARYQDRLAGLIVWNEPNLSSEWGERRPHPEAYAQLLRTVYPAVKAAAPDLPVLAAGLAPTLAPSGHPAVMSDLEYLERLYQAGAKGSFDGLAVHAYGWTSPPDEPPHPERINFRRVELLRAIMLEHGDPSPLTITEGGWNDDPRWLYAVSPARRIEYTLEAVQLAHRWPWLEALVFWAFRYPLPAHNYRDGFTFVAEDFAPRPIYLEVQAAARPASARPASATRPAQP